MEATLTEVINYGNVIQKQFLINPPVKFQGSLIDDVTLEYNQEHKLCSIIENKTEEILYNYDMNLVEEPEFDIAFDKIVFIDCFNTRAVKLFKECDDYTDLI